VPGYILSMMVATLDHDPRLVSDISYVLTALFIVGGTAIAWGTRTAIDWQKVGPIPLIIFGLWAYGVLLGVANGVPLGMVFRNFAGMALYPFVYLVIVALNPRPKLVMQAFILGSVCFVAMVIYLLLTVTPQGTVDSIGFISMRYHYYLATIAAVAVLLTLSVRAIVFREGQVWHALLAPVIFICLFYSGSRAFYAALAVSTAAVTLAMIPRWPLVARAILLGAGYLVSAAALAWGESGSASNVRRAVARAIEMEVSADSPRSQQAAVIWSNIDLFGHGLGASLGSFARDPVFTYALELSYVSLAHKIGIVGALIFLACAAFHVGKSLQAMVRSGFKSEAIMAVGLMGFLVSSWWNPTLFAPLFACLFCVSLYLREQVERDLVAVRGRSTEPAPA